MSIKEKVNNDRDHDHDENTLLPTITSTNVPITTTYIDLSDNNITSKGIEHLLTYVGLQNSTTGLKTIKLTKNPGEGTPLHHRLEGTLAVLTLQQLPNNGLGSIFRSISDRHLNDDSLPPIAEYLTRSLSGQNLIELGLHQNSIGKIGCQILFHSLSKHTQLTDLSIYSNQPGTYWGIDAADMLKVNTSIRMIDMGGCGISNDGAIALSKCLTYNNVTLTDLHLDHCNIGTSGMESLRNMMKTNTSLTNLWLHGNSSNGSYSGLGCDSSSGGSSSHEKENLMKEIHAMLERNKLLHLKRIKQNELMQPLPTLLSMFDNLVQRGKRSILRMLTTRIYINNDNNVTFGDAIAELSLSAYHEKCPDHIASWRGGQTVLSTIVITYDREIGNGGSNGSISTTPIPPTTTMAVVALGVGTKFLTPDVVAKGNPNHLIRDSHAEVLARRSFVRYLHGQLALVIRKSRNDCKEESKEESIFEVTTAKVSTTTTSTSSRKTNSLPYQLKSGYRFHLYTSLAPCGAASISDESYNYHHHHQSSNSHSTFIPPPPPLLLAKRGAPVQSSFSTLTSKNPTIMHILNGGFEKIDDPKQVIGNPNRRLSCTNKIIRWQYLGLQGGFISAFIKNAPISMSPSTIVIGRRYDSLRCSKVLARGRTTILHGHSKSLSLEGKTSQRNSTTGATATAVFGGSTGRSMGGDGDESLTWSAGEEKVHKHDGRTGLPMIPSIEVLDRLGERSKIATINMKNEFNILWKYYNNEAWYDNIDDDDDDEISLDKSNIASEEWLQLRAKLYASKTCNKEIN